MRLRARPTLSPRAAFAPSLVALCALAACASDPGPREVATVMSAAPSATSYWEASPPRTPMSAAPAPRESAAPAATALIGSPSAKDSPISGPIKVIDGPVPDALTVVTRMRAGLRVCYKRGLKEDPGMTAAGELTLEIGPPGDVTRARLSTVDGYLSGSVTSCIENRGKNAHFAPPDGGGGKATIVVPLTFAPPK